MDAGLVGAVGEGCAEDGEGERMNEILKGRAGEAERSDGPHGTPIPLPPLCLRRAAQGAPDAGRRQGARKPGSPSLAFFSWRDKKRESPCGGEHPAPECRADIHVLVEASSLEEGGSRDVRPAAHSLSFASPKESKQRKGDPGPRVPALRCGQPAVLAAWAHCTTRTVRCAHSARTGAMSQSLMRAMLARRPCRSAPRRGHRGGIGNGIMFGPSLRSALVWEAA